MGGTFSALIPELRIISGSLSCALLLLLSWLAFIWWRRQKAVYYASLSVLLALAGILSLISTHKYTTGWLGSVCLCVAAICAFWVISKSQPLLRVPLRHGIIATLCISLVMPALLIWSTHDQSYATLKNNIGQTDTLITNTKKTLSDVAENIASDTVIQGIAFNGTNPERATDLEHLFLSKSLQALTIVNTAGHVIARAQGPEKNDSILSTYPWFISVIQGDRLSGIAYGEQGGPLVVAGTPIMREGIQIGSLLVGQSIQEILRAQTLSLALAVGTEQGITSFSSSNQTEIQLFNAAALDDALREHLQKHPDSEQSFEFRITLNNETYRLVGVSKTTLTPRQPIALISIDSEQSKRPSPLLLGVASIIITLLSIGAMNYVLQRRESHAK